jgi:hypothetical protein
MYPKLAVRMVISSVCANQFIIDFSTHTGKNKNKRSFRSMGGAKLMYISTVCYN